MVDVDLVKEQHDGFGAPDDNELTMRYNIARNTINVKQRTLELDGLLQNNQISPDEARQAIGELYAQLAVSVNNLKSYSESYGSAQTMLSQADKLYHGKRRAVEQGLAHRKWQREHISNRAIAGIANGDGVTTRELPEHLANAADNSDGAVTDTRNSGDTRIEHFAGQEFQPRHNTIQPSPQQHDTGLGEVFNTALERSTQLRAQNTAVTNLGDHTPLNPTNVGNSTLTSDMLIQETSGDSAPQPPGSAHSARVRAHHHPDAPEAQFSANSDRSYPLICRLSPSYDTLPGRESRREVETLGSPVSFAPPPASDQVQLHRRDLSSLGSAVLSDIPVATPIVAHRAVRPQISYPFIPGRDYAAAIRPLRDFSLNDMTTNTTSVSALTPHIEKLLALHRRVPDLDSVAIQRELMETIRSIELTATVTRRDSNSVSAQRYQQLERRLSHKSSELDRLRTELARVERERDDAVILRETARRPVRGGTLSVAQRMLVYQYDSARMRARRQDLEFIVNYQRLELTRYTEERKVILGSLGLSYQSPRCSLRLSLLTIATVVRAAIRFERRGAERRYAKQLLAFRLQQTGAQQRAASEDDSISIDRSHAADVPSSNT
jgi:hypothetical protein